MTEPIKLICQLDSVRTTKDGGSKITFECGAESMKGVTELIETNGEGGVNFAVAVLLLEDSSKTN